MKKFTRTRKALILFCYTLITLYFVELAHTVNIEHKFVGEDGIRYFEEQIKDEYYIYYTYKKNTFGFESEITPAKLPNMKYENYDLVIAHYANNKLAYDVPLSFTMLTGFIILFSIMLSYTTSQIEPVDLDGRTYHVNKKQINRFHNEFTYIGLSYLFCFHAYLHINDFTSLAKVIFQTLLITYFVRRKKLI